LYRDRIDLRLADIFTGKIVSWDAAAITELNPGLHLRHLPIVVVHRQDGSGSTFNFVNYLSQVSEGWRDLVGTPFSKRRGHSIVAETTLDMPLVAPEEL
jgi:ABC-type phosphate transport system substrate-binding protein